MNPKQVVKRYHREFFIAMMLYMIVLTASTSILNRFEFSKFWQVVISLTPAVPVAFVIVALMRYLIDSDELEQRVHMLAITFAAAMTSLITFTYGFLELVGFPKFSTFFIFPMMIALWSLSLIYFKRRYQ